eukprot:TRINITY_DN4857_c0_g1_i1.p1 TRINITY_DN4857_c0_g1~~TRINITY_DN4857_c0_g1_i1.p1  ORF type:complete len:459 (+),score=88.43 TRINITY_DN4857_c0_g1_i1:110-1486(+)
MASFPEMRAMPLPVPPPPPCEASNEVPQASYQFPSAGTDPVSREEINAIHQELGQLRMELRLLQKQQEANCHIGAAGTVSDSLSPVVQHESTTQLVGQETTGCMTKTDAPSYQPTVTSVTMLPVAESEPCEVRPPSPRPHKHVTKQGKKTQKDLFSQDSNKMTVMLSTDPTARKMLADIMDKSLADNYSFQGSVYDAMVIAFTPVQNKSSSFFLIMILMLNAFVQLYYCSIVYTAFVLPQGEFTQEFIDGYRNWRLNVAHDVENMDKLSQVSLASRVCDENMHASLEFSTAQANAVEDINKYVTGFQGLGMTAVAVFCWLIFVADEIRGIIALSLGVKALYTGPTSMTVCGVGFQFEAMSVKRKTLIYSVLFLRLVVSGLLAGIGSFFLIYTRTVGDLILNAVALEMVQHMDRLMFRALAPTRVKQCMTMLNPLLLYRQDVERRQSEDVALPEETKRV